LVLVALGLQPLQELGCFSLDVDDQAGLGQLRLGPFGTLLQTSTGRPYSILSGLDDNGDSNRNDYAVIDDSNRALVTGAGQDVSDGLQGRSTARQPGSFVMDIRLSKLFDFGNAGTLEGIFEVFNLFNSANRLSTNDSVGSPNFGFLNIVGPPRQIQIGVRYRF